MSYLAKVPNSYLQVANCNLVSCKKKYTKSNFKPMATEHYFSDFQ